MPAFLKRGLFWAAALLPAAVLLALAAASGSALLEIDRVEIPEIEKRLSASLAARKGQPLSFTTVNGAEGFYYGGRIFVPFNPSPSEKLIYIFGGSSVVLPEYHDKNFSGYLERRLNSEHEGGYRVFNFGECGYDSFSVMNRVRDAIRHRRPDLAIIYSGHNDYIIPFFTWISGEFFLIRRSPLLNNLMERYFRHSYPKCAEMGGNCRMKYEMFLRQRLEPEINGLLQRAGLVGIAPGEFDGIRRIILENYRMNILSILEVTGKSGVPVILITPVGNLESRPYGIGGEADRLFNAGMAEKNYRKRVELLRRAVDEDLFSINVRAKSELNDFLRGMNMPHQYTLDIERELMDRGFKFNGESFVDQVHLFPKTHELFAEIIHEFIDKRGVLAVRDDRVDAR